jgi:hypothetical protein
MPGWLTPIPVKSALETKKGAVEKGRNESKDKEVRKGERFRRSGEKNGM